MRQPHSRRADLRGGRAVGLAVAGVAGLVALWSWPGDEGGAARTASEGPRAGQVAESRAPADRAAAPASPETRPHAELARDVLLQALSSLLGGSAPLDPARLSGMLERARDPALELRQRAPGMRWLARFGGREALEVLERLVDSDEPLAVRRAALRALGECAEPLCLRRLESALGEPQLAEAAVHGLARRGDEAAGARLRALALDAAAPELLREAAAAALGTGAEDGAALRETLARARERGDVDPGLLEALARRPASEVDSVFRELLSDPGLDTETRLAAVEALGEASPAAGALLVELAASSDDPALRSAAVESLGELADDPAALRGLGGLLGVEGEPAVRREIYSALALHGAEAREQLPKGPLLERVLAERSVAARLAGYRLVASLLHGDADADLARRFDGEMAPWLRETAEGGADRSARRLALDALKLAGTPGARESLLDLSHSTDPQLADSAERALRFARR